MAGDDILILPDDIKIIPVKELGQKSRALLQLHAGSYAITRKENSYPTKIIDTESAELLEEFRHPVTMVDAVLSYSRVRHRNPEQVLNKVLTLLQRLRYANVLVPASSVPADRAPAIPDLDTVSEYTIVECVHKGMAAVYKAIDNRESVYAIKLWGRKGGNPFLQEATVLERLDGIVTPAMREIGVWQGRQYLVQDWCDGICLEGIISPDVSVDTGHRRIAFFDRIDLAYRILRAYMEIHRRGVIHGEVHPKNIFIQEGGAVRIVDFFHAVYPVVPGAAPKGDCDLSYYEPVYALRSLSGPANQPMTPRDEQYAVASLLFHILSGNRYSADGEGQSTVGGPVPALSGSAIFSPDNIGRLLGRALSPDPAKRYPSLEEFAAAVMGAGITKK